MRHLRLRRARRIAAELIDSYGIHRPDQLEDVAWLLRAQVIDGGLNGALARVARFDKTACIRLSENHVEPGQRRFSIAHELGHYLNLSHRPSQSAPDAHNFLCLKSDISGWSGKRTFNRHQRQEQQANRFAIELLAPVTQMSDKLKP